jgi:hypothetical protein
VIKLASEKYKNRSPEYHEKHYHSNGRENM